MTQPEETPVSFIPPNFIEKGKILNGTFDIRNAIESIVLSLRSEEHTSELQSQ